MKKKIEKKGKVANELKEIGPFSGKNKRKAEKNSVKNQNWNEKGSD